MRYFLGIKTMYYIIDINNCLYTGLLLDNANGIITSSVYVSKFLSRYGSHEAFCLVIVLQFNNFLFHDITIVCFIFIIFILAKQNT